jgi:hypothetical protein
LQEIRPYVAAYGVWGRLVDFHGGGRMPVRKVLYMAALSACRDNPALKIFHNRLAAAAAILHAAPIAIRANAPTVGSEGG